jgi:DNA-binding response OmpR family regulator
MAPSENRAHRVLLLDDDASLLSSLARFLEKCDFEVLTAAHIDEAMDLLHRERVNALILDVRFTDARDLDRTGLDVLAFARLNPALDAVPIAILTGGFLTAAEIEMIQRHQASLFSKPTPFQILLAWLHDALPSRSDSRSKQV